MAKAKEIQKGKNNNIIIVAIIALMVLIGVYLYTSSKKNTNPKSIGLPENGGNLSFCSQFAEEDPWKESKVTDWAVGSKIYEGDTSNEEDFSEFKGKVTALAKGWGVQPTASFVFRYSDEIRDFIENNRVNPRHWDVREGEYC